MGKAIIDNFTEQELRQMVSESTSMRELSRKLGYTSIGNNSKTIYSRLEKYNISTDHFNGMAQGVVKRSVENVFIEDSTASQCTLRKWYIKGEYSEYKCAICGLEPFWNGKELTLTLDHVNGKNHDNRLENLRWVCPNCDRQLPTFGAKNPNKKTAYTIKEKEQIKSEKNTSTMRPSKDILEKVLKNNKGNFSAVGRQFKVSDNSVRKWCKFYDMPYHSKDYK